MEINYLDNGSINSLTTVTMETITMGVNLFQNGGQEIYYTTSMFVIGDIMKSQDN